MKSRTGLLSLVLALLCVSLLSTFGGQEMNMEQTLSDQAQGMTISFDGLAFLTGSLGADSFLPPGKVADFSGFQYLRDNDPTEMGHNTDFVTIIARNVLNILTSAQITQLVDRAESQVSLINQYGYRRFELIQAFRRNLTNAVPAGSSALEWAAVTEMSADLYAIDGAISLDRAQLFGDILRNMTAGQKSALDNLATLGGVSNWNQSLPDPLQDLHLSPDISVGVMTYASEMYSWYAGSVEADTYFCPERQGTYFGSFYLKDAPAMGNPNYTIDSNLTADRGNEFLSLLTPAQRTLVTNLVEVQKPYLYGIVEVRSNVSVHLRQLMVTNVIDTNAVMELCRHYGELDGMIVYAYATHFAQVGQSLTTNQQASLAAVRLDMLGTSLLYPSGAYLYSAPIAVPPIPDTDHLFVYVPTNCMPLEDTGQTNSYTSFFGEDADYVLDPPALTNCGGIVFDQVTGRMWQQTDSGTTTWEEANAYASSLSLGGYTDWRLPTAHELYSIVNHGAFNPALDTTAFTANAAEYWWTQDKQSDNTNNIWVVNVGGGIGPHPKTEAIGAGGTKRIHVRCVRGAAAPSDSALRHHFINKADGTVDDLDTGLTWQQAEVVATTWTSALHYSDSLSLAGHTDWRLPNIKELQSLNDETLAAPSLDTTFFPGAQAGEYWSSTTLLNDTNRAWTVDFNYGIASYSAKDESLLIRCVRGGGSNAVVAAGASPSLLVAGLGFTEGPAADTSGQVYFSGVTSNIIYRWSLDGQLSVFRTNSGGANGLYVDSSNNVLACEGDNGRLVSISQQTNVTVLAGSYAGQPFNEPNDIWMASNGGIYLTDPVYFGHSVAQGGEHVYYVTPDRSSVVRVVSDMVRPNGLVGTPDGGTIYIADWGSTNVFRYSINMDGTLTNKTLFTRVRCDGMTMDEEGRLYLCEDAVRVFNTSGQEVARIAVPERPTNVEFGGAQRQFLFITTDGGSFYSVRTSSRGVPVLAYTNNPPAISQVLHTPGVPGTNDTVCVTAGIVDDSGLESVTLTYTLGAFHSQTNTVFTETMRTSDAKPWSGDGCSNGWIIAWSGTNPFEQRAGANFGSGNTNGLEFKLGTSNLIDSMLTTAQGIDARGASGRLQFALWADGLSAGMGWALQLDNGSGYSTRLSEGTGTNHSWQIFSCNLQPSDLVSNLFLRFQFSGGSGDPRIDLDQISVQVVTAESNLVTQAMLDDGVHRDGSQGDGLYGAYIPSQTAGTVISYYLTAVDNNSAESVYPAGAPGTVFTYTVSGAITDSVGDGIPDWWRARYFGGDGKSTNSQSCVGADPDSDGVSNLAEYIADTNPTDALSRLRILGVSTVTGPTVFFESSPNRNYTLCFRTNLVSGVWTNVPCVLGTRGSGGVDCFVDPDTSGMQRFYRVVVAHP